MSDREWTVRTADATAALLWTVAVLLVAWDSADGDAGVLTAWAGLVVGAAATATVCAWLGRHLGALMERVRASLLLEQVSMVRPRNGERV